MMMLMATPALSFSHHPRVSLPSPAFSQFRINFAPRRPLPASPRRPFHIVAEDGKPDVLRVVGAVIKVGNNALDAGTNLVPEAVPRGAARLGVGVVGAVVVSYVLRSLFSTALFILGIAGLSYLAYVYISKDDDSGSGGGGGERGSGSSGKSRSTEDSLEEARRIMEKYK